MSSLPLSTLVPKPLHAEARSGELLLRSPVGVAADEGAVAAADLLRGELSRATGLRFESASADAAQIVLRTDGEAGEHYHLEVDAQRVVISGPPAGLVHGIYTLRQLLPAANWRSAPLPHVAWRVPACRIEDRPRFGWRGCMLDVSRHFTAKQTVLRFIDLIAMHHFNRLHLHLSDDQGWRVEIKAFPKLAEIASHRPHTGLGFATSSNEPNDGTPHGGYYTQDDVREIVAYAAARGIMVIPEIDLPGKAGLPGLTLPQRRFLVDTLGELPRESANPRYDPSTTPDHACKFVLRGARRVVPAEFLRVYDKIGRAYGFSVENAYLEDTRTGRGLFLAIVLYTNPDGILNDDRYAYEELAEPFLDDVAETIVRAVLTETR